MNQKAVYHEQRASTYRVMDLCINLNFKMSSAKGTTNIFSKAKSIILSTP